jgi:hypothetical protein
MKKLIALSIPLSVISVAFFTLNANKKLGSTDKVRYAGDLGYKKFCEAVVKDDVNMLKRSVRNKVGLVSFSEQRKASQVSQYLSNAM